MFLPLKRTNRKPRDHWDCSPQKILPPNRTCLPVGVGVEAHLSFVQGRPQHASLNHTSCHRLLVRSQTRWCPLPVPQLLSDSWQCRPVTNSSRTTQLRCAPHENRCLLEGAQDKWEPHLP